MSIGRPEVAGYALRILSDEDIVAMARVIYDPTNMPTGFKEEEADLKLGAADRYNTCLSCHNPFGKCPGHSAAIKLAIPIVQPIVSKDAIELLSMICPNCSRLAVPLSQRKGYGNVAALKTAHKPDQNCPFCKLPFRQIKHIPIVVSASKFLNTIATVFTFDDYKIEKRGFARGATESGTISGPKTKTLDLKNVTLIDNRKIWDILSKIPAEDCIQMGYHPEHDHPRKFMTQHVLVATHYARQRTHSIGQKPVNRTKQLHDAIRQSSAKITKALGQNSMDELKEESVIAILADIEKMVLSVTMLQTMTSANDQTVAQKIVFAGTRDSVSYMASLGKKKGILRHRIAAVRHDATSRAVLRGEPYGAIGTFAFPRTFAMRTAIPETVTVKNIDFLRSLVRNGKNKYPGALYFIRDDFPRSIDPHLAETFAAALKPGDVVMRHTLRGDSFLHNRYPSLHEESMDSLIITITNDVATGLPLATTDKKGADFDGDETQTFNPTSIGLAFSSLILQGCIRQLLTPKSGLPAIYGIKDVAIGMGTLMRTAGLNHKQVKYILKTGYTTTVNDLKTKKKLYTGNEIVSLVLPPDLYFENEKFKIEAGVVTQGKFDPNCIVDKGAYLLKYVGTNISHYTAIELLENLTRFAYTVNKIMPQSQPDEYRLSLKVQNKIRALLTERVDAINEYTLKIHNGLVHVPIGQIPSVYFDSHFRQSLGVINAIEIQTIIKEALSGTILEQSGKLNKFTSEITSFLGSMGQIEIDGMRPRLSLNHDSRALSAFPRFLDNAFSRGMSLQNFAHGVDQISHFWESSSHRLELFHKGVSVADQGYFSRKLVTTMFTLICDNLGFVRGPNNRILNTMYGHMNVDCRASITQDVSDWRLPLDKFEKKYTHGSNPEEYKQLIAIRTKLLADMEKYSLVSSNQSYSPKALIYHSPVDVDYLVVKYAQKSELDKKSKTKPEDIWAITSELEMKLRNANLRWDSLGSLGKRIVQGRVDAFKRIYMLKLCSGILIQKGYTAKTTKELCDAIAYKYICSKIQPGDAVGIKASHALSEPQVQGILKAIHLKGGTKTHYVGVQRTRGMDHLREMSEGTAPKFPITTVTLKGESKKQQMDNVDFTRKLNTVYMHELIYPSVLICGKDRQVYSEDEPFLKKWESTLPEAFKKHVKTHSVSSFKLRLVLDTSSLLLTRTSLVDIQRSISKAYPSTIAYVAIEQTQNTQTIAYVFFHAGNELRVINTICYDICNNMIVHGSGSFRNATVSGHTDTRYRVDTNGVNLKYVLSIPEVDHEGTFSSDIKENVKLFGIEETRGRLLEEYFYEAYESNEYAKTLRRHFTVLVDYQTHLGFPMFITRHSLRRNPDADVLTSMIFEETQQFVMKAIKEGRVVPIDAPAPRTLYGLAPKLGDGYNQVLIDTDALGITSTQEVISELDVLLKGTVVKKTSKSSKKKAFSVERVPTIDEVFTV